MTVTFFAAAEAAPLWNPLSITTLALASVGTLLGLYGAVSSYRKDHPIVRWDVIWFGPTRDEETGDELVAVWIVNRGAGEAQDVRIDLGSDGKLWSGDGWKRIGFGEGVEFHYWRPNELWSGERNQARGRRFQTTIDIELKWNQLPDLHRSRKMSIHKAIPRGAAPDEMPRHYPLAGVPLNYVPPETRDS